MKLSHCPVVSRDGESSTCRNGPLDQIAKRRRHYRLGLQLPLGRHNESLRANDMCNPFFSRNWDMAIHVWESDRPTEQAEKKREKYESIVRLTVAHNGEAVDQKLIFTYIRKCRVWNNITHQFISLSVKSRQAFLWDDHLKMQARYCWPLCDIHDLIHLSFCILVHVLCNMIFDSLTTQCCVVWPETAAEVWPGPNTIYSTLPDNNRYLGEWGGGGI